MPVPVPLIFTGIQTLSSLIQAYVAARKLGTSLSAAEIAAAGKAGAAKQPSSGTINAIGVIPARTLGVLEDNIDSAQDQLRRCLRTAPPADQDECIEKANAAICASLRSIKRLNQGTLPSRELQDLEKAHCP